MLGADEDECALQKQLNLGLISFVCFISFGLFFVYHYESEAQQQSWKLYYRFLSVQREIKKQVLESIKSAAQIKSFSNEQCERSVGKYNAEYYVLSVQHFK